MGGIVAYLTVVPIMSMTGRTQYTRAHKSGDFRSAASEQQGFGPAADIFCFLDQKLHCVFVRSGDKKAESIEQTAFSDSHRIGGNLLRSDIFDKGRGGSGCFESRRNRSEHVLFGCHGSPFSEPALAS